jgi:hypothetical protein
MNKISCLAVATVALCTTAFQAVSAVAMEGRSRSLEHLPPFMAGMMDQQPLIPLEKSLLWRNKTSSETSSLPSSNSTHAAANALIRGLLIANRTGEVGYTSRVSYRVQDVVRNLRRGKSIAFASNRCNVSEPILGRLLQLGKYTVSLN